MIARYITSNTGQKLMVPSPNSGGLIIDHLDGHAARSHFRYIIDQILKVRSSLDALRYMEVDSVEVDNHSSRRRKQRPRSRLPRHTGCSFWRSISVRRLRQVFEDSSHFGQFHGWLGRRMPTSRINQE